MCCSRRATVEMTILFLTDGEDPAEIEEPCIKNFNPVIFILFFVVVYGLRRQPISRKTLFLGDVHSFSYWKLRTKKVTPLLEHVSCR